MFDAAAVSFQYSARGDKKNSSLSCSVFGPSGIGLPQVEEEQCTQSLLRWLNPATSVLSEYPDRADRAMHGLHRHQSYSCLISPLNCFEVLVLNTVLRVQLPSLSAVEGEEGAGYLTRINTSNRYTITYIQ